MSDANVAREVQAVYEKTGFIHCTIMKDPVTCCGKIYYTEEGLRLHNHVSHGRKAVRSASDPNARPNALRAD